MTIKARFTLLLTALLAGFLLVLGIFRRMEQEEVRTMLANERQVRALLLNHWIEVAGRALPQFTADTAQSDEFATLLAQGGTSLQAQLEASVAGARLHAFWILRRDGSVVAQGGAGANGPPPPLPLPAEDFVALTAETPSPRFFAEDGGELLEVCAKRIQPPGAAGAEWFVAARRWDAAQVRALETLADARVTLRAAHENVLSPEESARLVLLRPLSDWRGHPLRTLVVESTAGEIERTLQTDWLRTGVFVVFGLLLITATALALQQWVVRPLTQIGQSLVTGSPAPVAAMAGGPTEVGRIAQLIVESFAQRAALVREIDERTRTQESLARSEATVRRNLEERARLGRDLHDGIIQSLYAAGMGLAGVRGLLRPEQTEVSVRLEQTRGLLNETIHDVRNFIIGLEPEALRLKTFSQALAALLETMRNLRPFTSTIEVDEGLAARLSLAQRVHVLQITREAVSNALRHGEANRLTVALRQNGSAGEFEVADDGRGFDAATIASKSGLANFAQRASELGGKLDVHSQPGEGTRVKLTFSLTTHD